MIRYSLACNKRHQFESWFASSAAYDKQAKRGLVACPVCGSAKVEKALMAPRLARTDISAARPSAPAPVQGPAPGTAPAAEAADPAPAASEPATPVAMISPQEQE